MKRIFKVANNINKLKFIYGQNPIILNGVKAGGYFDHIFTNHTLDDLLTIQERVKNEMEIEELQGIEANYLTFYAAVHVVIEPYRKGFIQSFNTSDWQKAECPFCGRKAGLAKIADNGNRKLICHFCWTEWEYQRLKCFNCGEESTEYALFEVDRHDVRVDTCFNCKSYLKTVSFEFSEEPYVIWDLKTVSLDDWAIKKGYKKPTPSLVGIDFTK